MKDTKQGILSTYNTTIFFIRNDDTLFISPSYMWDVRQFGKISPQLASYCFYKYAVGLYAPKIKPEVPSTIYADHWPQADAPDDKKVLLGIVKE